MGDGKRLPFAAIGKTQGNRLILWPPSDACVPGEFADGDTFAVHHLTLEISNDKTHFTPINPTTKDDRANRGWKLAPSQAGLRLWLIGAFRIALLEKQAGALEVEVRMPSTDTNRRVEQFERYAAEIKLVDVKTPPLRGDCLVTAILLLTDSVLRGPIEPAHFPSSSSGTSRPSLNRTGSSTS